MAARLHDGDGTTRHKKVVIFMVYVDIDAQHAQEFKLGGYNEEHLPELSVPALSPKGPLAEAIKGGPQYLGML